MGLGAWLYGSGIDWVSILVMFNSERGKSSLTIPMYMTRGYQPVDRQVGSVL